MNEQVIEETKAQEKNTLDREMAHFPPEDWDNGTFGVQTWLERTAWKTLSSTEYGFSKNNVAPPNQAIWEDPLLNQIYKLDLATFLNAEHLSVEGISAMVGFAPDEGSQIFLTTQAFDEARHFEVFCRRLADLGMTPEARKNMVNAVKTKEMRTFFDLIREQVDKKDYIAAILAHNVILEGMAYPVYRYEIKYWSRLDPGLSQIIQGAFADEVHHVTYGESFIREQIRKSVKTRNQVSRLAREFSGLMTDVFESVIYHYIGLYQEAANSYIDIMGDIKIFGNKRIAELTEEDQVRLLLEEVQAEYHKRLKTIGLTLD